MVEHEFWRRLGRSRFGSADLAHGIRNQFSMVRAMKNGFWKSIGKVPVLVLAVAVGPVALADGPALENIPADGTAAPTASAIPSTDPTASVSSPIRLISTDSILADPNCAPPAGAAAPICAQATTPCNIWSPCCLCNGCGGGCTFQWAPDKWCNVGVGIRTSFNHEQGDGVNDKNFFAVDETRLFFTGKVTQVIGFEVNTDISGAGGRGFTDSSGDIVNLQDTIHLLDAIVKFEFNDFVNFWTDRSSSTVGTTPSSRTTPASLKAVTRASRIGVSTAAAS
jgi:hypothetical protein